MRTGSRQRRQLGRPRALLAGMLALAVVLLPALPVKGMSGGEQGAGRSRSSMFVIGSTGLTSVEAPSPPVPAEPPAPFEIGARGQAAPERRSEATMPSGSPSGSAPLAVSPASGFKLGNEPVTVTIPISAAAQARIASLTQGPPRGRLRLLLEGVQVLHPGAVYQVYLDLPKVPPGPEASARPEGRPEPPQSFQGAPGSAPQQRPAADPKSPFYLGNLSLYVDTESPTGGITRSFDITRQVAELRRLGRWVDPVRVSFVLETPAGEPPKPSWSSGFSGPFLSVSRVVIVEG